MIPPLLGERAGVRADVCSSRKDYFDAISTVPLLVVSPTAEIIGHQRVGQ